ncbi:MAG: Flp family type IVb pilin [Sphingomonadaceae bacterium]|jgi:pilus assembly protein Flp/PilA|nr:Flp family type IVb pilin [Sphingomonadaceae bacterium]NBU78968.1 Flp family type IVb pilin [Sphingomonadaceae bacterium]NCA01927.1 Flp family type IVb pilin [Sphingomonadaceae bacterium]
MFSRLRKIRRDEKGASAVEYVLIVVIVAIGIITGVQTFGTNLSSRFSSVGTTVSTVR